MELVGPQSIWVSLCLEVLVSAGIVCKCPKFAILNPQPWKNQEQDSPFGILVRGSRVVKGTVWLHVPTSKHDLIGP